MKPKQLNKKLVLNKHSVSNLNNPEMKEVKGGFDPLPPSTYTCIFCDSDKSCPQGPGACFKYPPNYPTHTCETVSPADNCVTNDYTYCDCTASTPITGC